MRIVVACGARPNVVKVAALARAFDRAPRIEASVVHTGQHYDAPLSSDLFHELGLRPPDVRLDVGPGTATAQTAEILRRFDGALADLRPDRVIVVGDVTSTLACALVAAQRGIPLAHVEAGLRSFDPGMPEERNRKLTDHMSDLLFVTEPAGVANLRREGIDEARVHLVGNVMIDVLLAERRRADASDVVARLGLARARYVVATVHRPENVDDPDALRSVVAGLRAIACEAPVVFVVHPRTRQRLEALDGEPAGDGLRLVGPLGYHDFLQLQASAAAVVTDSGGVQEETAVLGIPCLTIRASTERPVTLTHGTNRLVVPTPAAMRAAWATVVRGAWPVTAPPELWDGRAADRIVARLLDGGRAT